MAARALAGGSQMRSAIRTPTIHMTMNATRPMPIEVATVATRSALACIFTVGSRSERLEERREGEQGTDDPKSEPHIERLLEVGVLVAPDEPEHGQ